MYLSTPLINITAYSHREGTTDREFAREVQTQRICWSLSMLVVCFVFKHNTEGKKKGENGLVTILSTGNYWNILIGAIYEQKI